MTKYHIDTREYTNTWGHEPRGFGQFVFGIWRDDELVTTYSPPFDSFAEAKNAALDYARTLKCNKISVEP